MAPQSESIPEYEKKRLENIKRNAEMMSSLKLQSRALELSSATKRNRLNHTTPQKKKPKDETPIVTRRSLRRQGLEPDESIDLPSPPVKILGPITMQEACSDDTFDRSLIDTVLDMRRNIPPLGKMGSLDLDSMVLKPDNAAGVSVMYGNIRDVKFFPCNDRLMVVAGNNLGEVAFWDVDRDEGGNEGIYLYQPHIAQISGISIHPHSMSKVFSSGNDGFIRLLDFEKESFGLIYSSNDIIYSLAQRSQDADSLYFSDDHNLLNVWDTRAGKLSSSYTLHKVKINSIDFNPENANLMATSSTDRTACIWDLRRIDAGRPKNLMTVRHNGSVQGAYFSPGGSCLATTSLDDNVGMHSGADFRNTSMIYHKNHTATRICPSRAMWGWDDAHIFVGSLERKVDVISVEGNTRSLRSSNLATIPRLLAAHPYKVGTLAAATHVGQIYLWIQN